MANKNNSTTEFLDVLSDFFTAAAELSKSASKVSESFDNMIEELEEQNTLERKKLNK